MHTMNTIKLLIIGIALCIGLAWLMGSTASAEGLFYFSNLSPQNNPLEYSVKQGDTIYLGKVYDFSKLAGFSKEYAFWQDWKKQNADCDPDKIIDTRYHTTFTNNKANYLDPKIWNTGDWYQWDGGECNLTHYNYETHEWEVSTDPLPADNKFAFRIISLPPAKASPLINILDIEEVPPYKTLYI